GLACLTDAKAITVGLSQAVLDISFSLQLVRMSRLSGHVSNPDGTPVTSGNVNLMSDATAVRGNRIGTTIGGRIQWDGAFAINNVPPGRYILRARGDDSETPQFAAQPVSMNGEDVTDFTVILSAGATVSGTLTTESGTPLPDYAVLAFPTDASLCQPQARQIMTARPDQTGKYRIRGLPPGQYYVATVDPTEQGEWFEPAYLDEHRAGAARLTLGDGDVKTQDFKVS